MQVIYRQSDTPDAKQAPVLRYKKPTLTERAILLSERLMANYQRAEDRRTKKANLLEITSGLR